MTAAHPQESPLILVVDDDADATSLVRRWLYDAGFRVRVFDSAEAFLTGVQTSLPDAVCLDIGLPGLSGMDALDAVRASHPEVPVLMVSADDAVESVVEAMRRGAVDYLAKPLEEMRLLSAVHNAVERFRSRPQSSDLLRASERGSYRGIVGRSPEMCEVFRQIERVGLSDISVLIHGESGTGKELVARALHEQSPRCAGPFVAVNCASIPDGLLDSELFGHERGAFTGAIAQRPGRFEQAHGGTLFLDEVAELSASAQAKLLRVLQERRFERVGGVRPITSDFRLLAASHQSLRERVEQGVFREDLFFRIAVFELDLPPLRAREGDLPLLVPMLLEELSPRHRGAPLRVSPEALRVLEAYPWPGNVRELCNVLERAAVIAEEGQIEPRDLPLPMRTTRSGPIAIPRAAREAEGPEAPVTFSSLPAALNLDEIERWAIEQAIEHAGGNMAEVVRKLGIGKTTLYRKLKKFGFRS